MATAAKKAAVPMSDIRVGPLLPAYDPRWWPEWNVEVVERHMIGHRSRSTRRPHPSSYKVCSAPPSQLSQVVVSVDLDVLGLSPIARDALYALAGPRIKGRTLRLVSDGQSHRLSNLMVAFDWLNQLVYLAKKEEDDSLEEPIPTWDKYEKCDIPAIKPIDKQVWADLRAKAEAVRKKMFDEAGLESLKHARAIARKEAKRGNTKYLVSLPKETDEEKALETEMEFWKKAKMQRH